MGTGTYHTQHRTLLKAVVNDDWSVRSVLSLPVPDLADDVVIPSGLNFDPHKLDPWLDLEHGLDPTAGRRPVAWARKSLARAGGSYAVEWADLDVPGVGKSRLPVGTSYFDRDDPLSRQVYHLVRKGALPGVSLEFKPVAGFMKSRGPSPLERRDAFEFRRADVVRWTHCVEPVCPGALTVLKSLPAPLDALARVLRDGRIENEPLHPIILKSLARYKPAATLVRVEKAMNDDAPETVYDDAMPEDMAGADAEGGDGGPPNNGVSALYAHAQALVAACDQLDGDLEHTDSPELYREGAKLCDQVRALAEKVKAAGDKHDAKLSALKSGGEEPAEPEAGAEPEADMATDDDGTLKAVRRPYRSVLKAVRGVKRYSLAEVTKGIADAQAAERPETVAEALARLRTEDPAEYERLSQKARRLNRLQTT